MPASDGSSDTYLVPGYRLTSDDGHLVDIPALPDDLLADGSADESAPTVTQPATTDTGMESPPCTLTEEDSSGSTHTVVRSEEHTSELQSLIRSSYAAFCLQKKNRKHI